MGSRIKTTLQDQRYTLLAGLLGALGASLVMILLRLTVGTPTLPELVGERILPLLSVDRFIQLLIAFQPHSKTGPLGLALLSQIVFGVLVAPLLHRLAQVPATTTTRWPNRRNWVGATLFTLAAEAIALALFWPVMNQGLAGDPPALARGVTALTTLIALATLAAITLLVDHGLRGAVPALSAGTMPSGLTRRTLFGVVIAAGMAEVAGIWAGLNSYLERSNLAYEGTPTPATVRNAITPIGDFYVVSKNVLDPVVERGRWRLEVGGLVATAKTFTYDTIRALPEETRAITMECISNQVGARLMSTGMWRGATLKNVLDAVGGVTPGNRYVIFRAADGFATSLPLTDLLDARTLLAWEMNGVPLPDVHGGPLRVIVPGRYGEQSAKWITGIEISDHPFKGFYQSQGWSDHQVNTTSRIDLPSGTIPRAATAVQGIAFAGIRGIQRVEVSADAGQTWNDAQLEPPLSDHSWVFWSWNWTPAAAGRSTLVVRATDKTGAVQPQAKQGTVPNGSQGWHHVSVVVL